MFFIDRFVTSELFRTCAESRVRSHALAEKSEKLRDASRCMRAESGEIRKAGMAQPRLPKSR